MLSSALAMNGRTTYQAKIIKPDGSPLESTNVNFQFTILDPTGSCTIYTETYSAVNMTSTGGLISFALGNGTRVFPGASATTAVFAKAFDNSITSVPCQISGIFNPSPTDNRKIVMQFNEGFGWQTLPAMAINVVPYAMYAGRSNDSTTLNGKADTAFVENATLAALSCNAATHAITFNGVSFSCIAVGAGGGGINSVTTSGTVLTTGGTASAPVIGIQAASFSQDGYLTSLDYAEFKAKLSASGTSSISNTSGNITLSPNITTGSVIMNSTTAANSASTGALVVNGGVGVGGNIFASGTIVTSSNLQGASITATSGLNTNVIQGNINLFLNPNGGNVGIGTSSPTATLNVSGAIVSNSKSNAAGVTNINFSTGNVQISTNSTNNAAFNICGLQDGGSYSLVLKSQPINSVPTFTPFSDSGCTTTITNFDAGGQQFLVTSTTTIITFIRAGDTVYAMFATGFTN